MSKEVMQEAALQHLDILYRTALRMTSQPAEAEDLVQDTYLRSLKFHKKFQPGTNLKAWLFKMMINLFINKYRRQQKTKEIQEGTGRQDLLERTLTPDQLASTTRPQEYFFEKMFSDEVVLAIDSLPQDFKLVVLLADVNEFSYSKISEILDIPVGTVMSRLHRGRKMLKESLYQFAIEEGYVKTSGDKKDQVADLNSYRTKKVAK
jgi:RNA polymerase sigma-70 factor (ECF subfamily)